MCSTTTTNNNNNNKYTHMYVYIYIYIMMASLQQAALGRREVECVGASVIYVFTIILQYSILYYTIAC